MGNESFVLWLSAALALGYFIAVIVGMVGLLQAVAVQWQRDDLLWLPRSLARPLGLLAILGAGAWFYLRFYRLIFVPGPAGLELMVLFGGGSILAIWLTRLLHWLTSNFGSRAALRVAEE